jgi:dipeptidyl aminopeptidase/acylaminoacyl peptidase
MDIRWSMAAVLLSLFSAVSFASSPDGVKRQMEIEDLDGWQTVGSVKATDDGGIATWTVSPQEGDGILYVRKFASGKKSPEANLQIPRGVKAMLDPEGRWLYCIIKPEFKVTRQEKIKKLKKDKMTPDTLAVVDLSSMTVKKYPVAEEFGTGAMEMPLVAYKTSWEAADTSKAEGSKDGAKSDKDGADAKNAKAKTKKLSGLVILNPAEDHADTLLNVDKFSFSNDCSLIAFTTKKDEKDSTTFNSMQMGWYEEGKLKTEILSEKKEAYGSPVFSDAGDMMAFTATADTNKTGDKAYSLSLATISRTREGKKGPEKVGISTEEILGQDYADSGTGWKLDQNSNPFFTPDGQRLIVGISSILPPKDTTIVDFETAGLDVWNWDAPYTPPQMKKNEKEIKEKTYPAVINLDGNRTPVLLTDKFFEDITLLDAGASDWALARDESDYVRSSVWTYKNLFDFYLVNLNDGSRKEIAKKLDIGTMLPSPNGKYLLYFSNADLGWHTIDLGTGTDVNLTKDCGVAFYDEENDRPMAPDPYDYYPEWIEGDQAVLVGDRYDLWRFAPDGSKAENLTGGVLREKKLKYSWTSRMRTVRTTPNQEKSDYMVSKPAKGLYYICIMNEDDMTNGFATLDMSKPEKTLKYFTDTVSFGSFYMPEKSERLFFTKSNFRNCADLYASPDGSFQDGEKLTAINPQKDELRWGHAELFRWKAYDGTPLKGIVYIPDGVKEGEKLPVMIYFYEKYSNELYSFFKPGPSRSIVNPSYYTSRGYLFFIPDIVYKVGHPGESAYNCICSGAEALCEAYPIADKSRMAIQGQSWGGYQTAYLVTRTDMFAAAGAGAPVGNMTSAYGGIRWESGITRAGQYEHGQSRIGKSLWDEGGLDLYIENSPVFHADKVQTPILIMHNDADGAVPWYQGIEFFSDLRRLDKPAWMLEYNDEAHNLVERRNCLDLTRRLQQFFDHYLKGGPLPAWMKTGIPIERKGQYFGFEEAQ